VKLKGENENFLDAYITIETYTVSVFGFVTEGRLCAIGMTQTRATMRNENQLITSHYKGLYGGGDTSPKGFVS